MKYNFLCLRSDDHVLTGASGQFADESSAFVQVELMTDHHPNCEKVQVWAGPVKVFTVFRQPRMIAAND